LGAAWPLAVLVDDLGHRREEIRAHQVRGVDGVVVHVRLPPKHPSLHQHRRPVGAGRVGPGDVARRVIPHGVDLAQRPAGGAESLHQGGGATERGSPGLPWYALVLLAERG